MTKADLTDLACSFKPGATITGKWNSRTYKIIRQLGKGANGVVYLVASARGNVALKISDDTMSITSEVNVLKAFSKARSSAMGPSLYDADDTAFGTGKQTISFYVMEYVQGPLLKDYVQNKGEEWITVLIIQLLNDLSFLHQEGWVFGDLKPENLIVAGPPPKIRCIDVGGATKAGRAIKEYTEFFDRGYWGFGTRKAEPSYDLFAVAMIMINCAVPQKFKKSEHPKEQLFSIIEKNSYLRKYKNILLSALYGHYSSAGEMRRDLIGAGQAKANRAARHQDARSGNHAAGVNSRRTGQSSRIKKNQKVKKPKGGIAETLLIIISIVALYFAYIILFLA
jgi:serine/threonine-protein kinase